MKNIFFLVFLFTVNYALSQQDFYIEINSDLADLEYVKQSDKNFTFKSSSQEFSEFLMQQKIIDIKEAYPQAKSERLKNIYWIRSQNSTALEIFLDRKEIIHASSVDQPDLRPSYPNDYYDERGVRNTALDLIRAPQAWHLTKGDSSVVVGIVDKGFDVEHEDLKNQIVTKIQIGNASKMDHGTTVAGSLAAETNNGKGFSSIAYQSKLAIVDGNYSLEKGLDTIADLPGIRIVNASWGYCGAEDSKRIQNLLSIVKKLEKKDILVVAAAGNGKKMKCFLNENDKINGYRFPASFEMDNVISVTSVGHIYDYGHYSEKYKRTRWKDCHENNPFTDDESLLNKHTHNDRVDISAPGLQVNILQKESTYDYENWGTSQSSPYVAGTAALMLAINPELSAKEMKEILLHSSDEIYHLPCNHKYEGLLGKGRLNAYRAVLSAKCKNESDPKVDLMVRDGLDDFGEEVYAGYNYDWQSPDIWIRNQNDGKIFTIPQKPVYSRKKPNYVYVRVTNTGCKTSTGEEELNLFWAKTEDDLNELDQNNEVSKKAAGKVGRVKIPALEPGEEGIVEIPWKIPNPRKYRKYDRPKEFILMAKIISEKKNQENLMLIDRVVNSKKIAWKKVEAE